MAANKSKKKRHLIVDKNPNTTPYHLKRRDTNLNGKLSTKIIVIFMILAFVVGPVIGLIVIIKG